jgi:hypothetical protein
MIRTIARCIAGDSLYEKQAQPIPRRGLETSVTHAIKGKIALEKIRRDLKENNPSMAVAKTTRYQHTSPLTIRE